MPLGSLVNKYTEFGWTAFEIDGHDPKAIITALETAKKSEKPVCIIAKTILGKGISFMENNHKYHDVKGLSQELYEQASRELKSSNP